MVHSKPALLLAGVLTLLGAAAEYGRAFAQQAPSAPGWQTGVKPGATPAAQLPAVTQPAAVPGQQVNIRLEAVLTDDGQRIEQGLVWRVFKSEQDASGRPKLVATLREPAPVVRLTPGDYSVNVAFGRANLTRKIQVKTVDAAERFVLNAGGLKVIADVGGQPPPPNSVSYSVQADERDQRGQRVTILQNAKPGLIIRLNAGIYQITSTYGDANATVRAYVTVEAGKLTEASISHSAAKVAFKLVTEPRGDALPGTRWSIQTRSGEIVKESVGVFPTHILAPGTYAAFASRDGKTYRRDFMVKAGDTVKVEVVIR